MPFLYETHLHTSQGSACGVTPGREHVAHYKALGYAGIFITDHFFGGNCAPDRALPWETWVNQFCAGYEDAKIAGDKQGLQVFFGLEQRFAGDEWLIYGLDKAYLLAHPDMPGWSRADWLRRVRAAGGCCVQAHPFRDRAYIDAIHISLGVDGAEAANSGNLPAFDVLAARYAAKFHLFMTAGSDLHREGQFADDTLMGVAFDKPLVDERDYALAVRTHRPHALRVPQGRCEGAAVPALGKPLVVYGRDGEMDKRLTLRDIL